MKFRSLAHILHPRSVVVLFYTRFSTRRLYQRNYPLAHSPAGLICGLSGRIVGKEFRDPLLVLLDEMWRKRGFLEKD
jgi:hypothetical protein